MIYQAYQAHADLLGAVRTIARLGAAAVGPALPRFIDGQLLRNLGATYALLARAGLTHSRPAFGIDRITLGNREVAVREVVAHATPFGDLLHFEKDSAVVQPRVLVVAPMSGHFATLLRGTVRTLLPEHDVFITDWHNARHVGLAHGRFDFDDFIDHVITFLELIGPGAHVLAVCQPCVAVLAAVSLMAAEGNQAQPRSMTLMAGPIDTRVHPTKVDELATSRPIEWFERNLITTVPLRHPGALRRVYPGFLQLMAFMSMNLERHLKAHADLFDHLVKGDQDKAEAIRSFYDEYFAVMDLPAEFYLQTIRKVFQEHLLPLGQLESRGRLVEPRAIRRTALLTVEGERDDICAIGQTLAAQDLCSGLRPYMKRHYVQTGVGHYGVFNGARWNKEIYPILRNQILASA
jgi:polyhydroxyalkanoate depolymerase